MVREREREKVEDKVTAHSERDKRTTSHQRSDLNSFGISEGEKKVDKEVKAG